MVSQCSGCSSGIGSKPSSTTRKITGIGFLIRSQVLLDREGQVVAGIPNRQDFGPWVRKPAGKVMNGHYSMGFLIITSEGSYTSANVFAPRLSPEPTAALPKDVRFRFLNWKLGAVTRKPSALSPRRGSKLPGAFSLRLNKEAESFQGSGQIVANTEGRNGIRCPR
jgi:hypothetical protein